MSLPLPMQTLLPDSCVEPGEALVIGLELAIEKHRLWSRLRIDGSRPGRTLVWWRMLDEWAAKAREVIRPRGTFRLFDVEEIGSSEVRLSEGIRLRNLRQARLLLGAEKIALCGLTLGAQLEELSNTLALAGDYPEASILSMIGDCALAEGQVKLQSVAQAGLEDHFAVGVSLQPGAQYWSIRGNELFFHALPLESMGMALLESSALYPAKSKTFACALNRTGPRVSRTKPLFLRS